MSQQSRSIYFHDATVAEDLEAIAASQDVTFSCLCEDILNQWLKARQARKETNI